MTTTPERLTADKATIYYRGGMGAYVRHEVRSVDVELKPYAQYRNAVVFRFVPKGKRKARGAAHTYKPSLLILEGHGHPEPPGMFEGGKRSGIMDQSKYSSCDEGWDRDFNAKIDAYIAESGARVLADYRGFKVETR